MSAVSYNIHAINYDCVAQGRRERGGEGAGGGASSPHHHFVEQKFSFHAKSEKIKLLHVNNM